MSALEAQRPHAGRHPVSQRWRRAIPAALHTAHEEVVGVQLRRVRLRRRLLCQPVVDHEQRCVGGPAVFGALLHMLNNGIAALGIIVVMQGKG